MTPQEIKGAKLEEFERAVYSRTRADEQTRIAENDKAVRVLREALLQLREGAGFEGYERMDTAQMTRMCAAMVTLFSDPGFRFTQDGFDYICGEKAVIDTLFRASAFRGSDYVYRLIGKDEQEVSKYLMLFSANSEANLDLEAIFRRNPQATVGLYLSLLGYGQIVTPQGHERREKLLGMADIFKDVELSALLWNTLCSAYMHCSYAVGRNKHDGKKVFHQLLANVLKKNGIPEVPPLVRTERPRLLIIFEWWWSKHAMFRSYAHSIRQLRKRFHLIGCCAGKNTDKEARDIFDEWIELDGDNMNLADVVPQLTKTKPDMIYYPSIGMAIWVIALASLRLAPVQIMGYGHPATSNSPEIDYGIIEEDCYTEGRFNERVITLPPNTVRPTAYEPLSFCHEPRKTDVVKIGVSAMQVKLTYPFVQALKEVQKRAKKKVELWFFSAAHGIGMFSLAQDLAAQLENVWVQEKQFYTEYMNSVAGCDLVLFSFPFGGANSAYDALSLGVPMVSLKGEEPHSMSDASIITRAGLPQEIITHSVEDYIAKIVDLVEDDDKRAEIARLTKAVDVEAKFYQPDESDAFLKAFERIYDENCVYGIEAVDRKVA